MSADPEFNRFASVVNRADLDRLLARTAVSLDRATGTARYKWLALKGAIDDYVSRLEQIALAESMSRHPSARRCAQTFTAPGTGAGYVCAREPHSDLTHDWQPLDRGAAL